MKEPDPFYRSKRWKDKREKILRRDGYMCQDGKRYGKRVPATTVHHIFPREEYPEIALDDWNLISLSAAAHDEMHDRESGGMTKKGKDLQDRTERRERLRRNPWFEGRKNG